MKMLLLLALPALCLAQLGMPGGITETHDVSLTAEPVVYAVQKVNEMMTQSNGGAPSNLQLQEIVKARTQVVSGQMLYLTLHLTGDYYCDVNVWYQAWNKSGERCSITKGPDCHHKPAAAPRAFVGGVGAEKPIGTSTAASVMDSLNFAACAYNAQSNAMFASQLGDVSHVTYTEQVVRGMKYTFHNVPMTETTCNKNGANGGCNMEMLNNCMANDQGMKQMCTFSVVFVAWESPKMSLVDMSCQ